MFTLYQNTTINKILYNQILNNAYFIKILYLYTHNTLYSSRAVCFSDKIIIHAAKTCYVMILKTVLTFRL